MRSGYKAKIEDIGAFSKFSPTLRANLADILVDISSTRVLEEGETLYQLGAEDPNTGALLVYGSVIVDPGRHGPTTVAAPEILGEMQQFNRFGQRTATVRASGSATVLEFAWNDFVERVRDRPEISHDDKALIRESLVQFVRERFMQL